MAKLTKNLSPDEFKEYYFFKDEIKDFCRLEGFMVCGYKKDLENRIIHYLSTGEMLEEPVVKEVSNNSLSTITLDSILGENF